ncbi:MAG TPA: hydantoinase/oxoprolinase family protein [Noviherbaspirillum sp.]|nr:hydantoinase/oxoprolinase family protein [Noviherbaspirillum sp.]
MYRIGIDVGGTFTDFTLLNEDTFEIAYFKISSTPKDPSEAIRNGIAQMLTEHRIAPEQLSFVGHGTTVATNMIIERRGVPTGLITTRGFRDVLEIGRQTRPNLFDYSDGKPEPLVAREHRFEITERMGADGEVITPLDRNELEAAIAQLREAGVQAVAICFLHAYRNPAHEQEAREMVERMLPNVYVSVSSEVLPEFREYERLSTTVLNAYSGPKMQAYLDRLSNGVREMGIPQDPYTIHSNGGLMSIPTVRRFPVRTCLSGPASGVVGSAVVGMAAGFPNVITFDVGGTSTDVSVIKDGKPVFTSNRLVADYPIKMPMVDIHVIGAGGGSVAWIDDAGALKAGPHSAGALPGPVAYGRGGTEPTTTDVNVCLHRLNPVSLLRGRLAIDEAGARNVIDTKVAQPLGLGLEAAAHGILRIVTANMSRAIRSVSTERGYNLSEFALYAYGGAGPLHAAEVAEECGIPTVIVPQEPGTMCARGILLSDVSLDFVRTEIAPANEETWAKVCAFFDDMTRDGTAWLEQERVVPAQRAFRRYVEARYEGQNYEIAVELDSVDPNGLQAYLEQFRAAHVKEYGYAIPGRTVQIVNCRTEAIGRVPKAELRKAGEGRAANVADAAIGVREVYFGEGAGWVPTTVYERSLLPVDTAIAGPAIIEEMSSTTVVLPRHSFKVDTLGNIIIRVRPEEHAA